tara:strand:+ start:367 stop:504 length:138 start_codon:yes stop_codon:yes gene_type:complete
MTFIKLKKFLNIYTKANSKDAYSDKIYQEDFENHKKDLNVLLIGI